MQYSAQVKLKIFKTLASLVVGFLALAPALPAFYLSADVSLGKAAAQSTGDGLPDEAFADPQTYLNNVINNPSAYGYGPDSTDDENNDQNNEIPGSSDQSGGLDPAIKQAALDNPSQFLEDVLANPENYIETDDGSPLGPDSTPGPDTGSLPDGATSDNLTESAAGGVASSSGNLDAAKEALAEAEKLLSRLPRSLEEAIRFREEYYDELAVTTDDSTANAQTQTNTAEPEATIQTQNNANDIDDTVAGSNNTSTDGVTVNSDNFLEQENVTEGSAVSGDNTIASTKENLEGVIRTGNTDIRSQGEVKGNTNNVSTSGGGSGGGSSGWIQKLWGADSENNVNDTSDSVVSGEAQEVKSLTILNRNSAFVSNVKKLLSKSGGNLLSGVGRVDESGIFTGAATAKSGLLNIINTNTVDSHFAPLTFDIFDNYTGNINILEMLFEAFGSALNGPAAVTSTAENNVSDTDDSIINSSASAEFDTSVFNENNGFIYNDLDIQAISGQNQALAGRKLKETVIESGPVRIANNLINFLNTNLYKSSIGVVVINVFADWMGNLIIPDAAEFAGSVDNPLGATAGTNTNATDVDDSINQALAITNSSLDIVNVDHGEVETNIAIQANTGNNYTSFQKNGDNININTGNVDTMSNILTLTNRNIIGAAFSQGFFNILGDWTGDLVGAPEDALIAGDRKSFVVATEGAAMLGRPSAAVQANNNLENVDDSVITAEAEVNRSVTLNNHDTGKLVNRLNIVGDSGNNSAASYKGQDVTINTGDVGVANNIANFLNMDFAFTKGLLVHLNVFGNWKGNVAYDEFKDLSALIEQSASDEPLKAGDGLTYAVSAVNTGTEPTDPGVMSFAYDPSKLELVDEAGGDVSGNTIAWPYPGLESAEKFTKQPEFKVKDGLPEGDYGLQSQASVTQDDINAGNNSTSHQRGVSVRDDNWINDNSFLRDRFNAENNDPGSDNNDTGNQGNNQPAPDDSGQETETGQDQEPASDAGNNQPSDQENDQPESGNPGNSPTGNQPAFTSGSGSSHTPGYLVVEKKNGGNGPYRPGDEVTYQIKIHNYGDTRIEDIVLYDQLISDGILGDISWPLEYINASETITVDYAIAVDAAVPTGSYINNAYASGFDAANAVIKSNISSTQISVINPEKPAAGSDAGSLLNDPNAVGNEPFSPGMGSATSTVATSTSLIGGVIDQFNAGADSSLNIAQETEAVGGPDEFTQLSNSGLTDDEAEQLEKQFESNIRDTSRINRQQTSDTQLSSRVFIAGAEDKAGDDTADGNQLLGGNEDSAKNQKLAYAVYPNFLNFDGMENDALQGGSEPLNWLLGNWLVWLLLILAILIGYFSYREKRKLSSRVLRW